MFGGFTNYQASLCYVSLFIFILQKMEQFCCKHPFLSYRDDESVLVSSGEDFCGKVPSTDYLILFLLS